MSGSRKTWTVPYYSLAGSADPNDRYRALKALGEALHPVMDSTSPAHRGWQVWNVLDAGGIRKHGDNSETIEDLKALTPQLLAETLQRIREVMNGTDCECVLK